MIILHRQNNSDNFNSPIEIDLRFQNSEVVLNHDPIDNKIEYRKFSDIVEKLNFAILNCKESGVEEHAIPHILNGKDFYFLDSQIPDILRLSKKYPQIKNRFIIRISDVEMFSEKLMSIIDPKYVWLDWSEFNTFNEDLYFEFINKTIDKLGGYRSIPIIVSPELYSLEYVNLAHDIMMKINKCISVCTKIPDEWGKILAKPKESNR